MTDYERQRQRARQGGPIGPGEIFRDGVLFPAKLKLTQRDRDQLLLEVLANVNRVESLLVQTLSPRASPAKRRPAVSPPSSSRRRAKSRT